MSTHTETMYNGKYLQVHKRGTWEYVTRPNATGIVVIVALHDDGRLIVIEQYRPAVKSNVIELPAGLVGDIDDTESLLTAAQRELEEETGYTAANWTQLYDVLSSSGLTDEESTFFLATQLTKTSEGGGVEDEDITIHEVPLTELEPWLAQKKDSCKIASKLFTGIYMATIEQQRKE